MSAQTDRPHSAHLVAVMTDRRRSEIYCVPMIDFGHAVLDCENHVLAISGRRIFLSIRKLHLLSLLLIAGGETVPLWVLAAQLGVAETKYPHHMIARIIRELRVQLAPLPLSIAVRRTSLGYQATFVTTQHEFPVPGPSAVQYDNVGARSNPRPCHLDAECAMEHREKLPANLTLGALT